MIVWVFAYCENLNVNIFIHKQYKIKVLRVLLLFKTQQFW